MTQAEIDTLTKGCQTMHDQVIKPGMDLFDQIIVKALLPVFTSILGYIFGAHAAATGSQPTK